MKTQLENFIDEHNRIVFSQKNEEIFSETFVKSTPEGFFLEKMVVDGKWSLLGDNILKLSLSSSDPLLSGKTIIFKGEVISHSASGLTFRVRHSDALSGEKSRTIELKGVWALDNLNRLTFRVSKADGKYDTLSFNGAWNIGANNELSYRVAKTHLKTKVKVEKALVFRGHWDLYRTRIVYSLEGDGNSFFSFKAAIQSKSLMAKKGEIRYQLGAGTVSFFERSGKVSRTVAIYGIWKLSHDLKVSFEVKCPGSEKREINFGIEKMFAENRKITVALKDRKGETLGLDVTFTKVFSTDAEFFASIGVNASECRILGGIRMRF